MADVWRQHARQWQRLGPPLRPCPDDVRVFERWVAEECTVAATSQRTLQALLLGVTPEHAGMRWPEGVLLTAVDRSQAMIDAIWPGPTLSVPAKAVCAEWQALPFPDGGVRVVVGDGCFTTLEHPRRYHEVAREVTRVLGLGGSFLHRFFVRPARREPLNAIFHELRAGKIRSFHALKWRVAMALHGRFEEGVSLRDVWDTFAAERLDASALENALDWPPGTVATVDAYRGLDTRYTFPTLDELRDVLRLHFVERECSFGRYELADCCPRLRLSPL